MASTGIINATILAITVGGTKIDVQLSADLSISKDPRTSINKDSGGWEETYGGKKSWEMSGEAEYKPDATEGYSELFAAFIADTEVTLDYTTAVSGDSHYTGVAQVTKLDLSGGVEENGKMSYSFKGNGAIAEATVA